MLKSAAPIALEPAAGAIDAIDGDPKRLTRASMRADVEGNHREVSPLEITRIISSNSSADEDPEIS
jgi:hypothetical protein